MKISFQNRRAIEDLYSPSQYTQTKTIKDIPDSVAKDVKLVSLKGEEDSAPFGSYINRIADYFGDIDAIQVFTGCCSIKAVGTKTAKAVQEMVKGIKRSKNRYFSEFKAGIDEPYYFNIGKLVQGEYKISKQLKSRTEKLHYMGFLSDTELKVIMNVINKEYKTGDDYDAVFNLFREHFLLRWTEKEVLQGYKTLKTGKYKLEDAVLDHAPVKIDMIAINDGGKFIEVTNFMALGMEKGKKFVPINIDLKAMTPEDLPIEIEKLYYSNYFYKPFKIVKRAFAYLKYTRNQLTKGKDLAKYHMAGVDIEYVDDLLMGYAEIIKSTINILYTINSELDAMRLVLERVTNPPKETMRKRLDQLKEPLANVLEIPEKQLGNIMAMVDGVKNDLTPEKIETLMKTFKEIINFWTMSYFDQLGLNPPPSFVLPKRLSYDPNIVREPWDTPANPLKLAIAEAEGRRGGFFKDLGKNIFMKAANAYRRNFCDGKARPLHKGEYHLGCHNFTGPGTRIDLPEVRAYKPYNAIDECARQHDFDYMKAVEMPDNERKKAITEADKEILKCVAKHPNVSGYNAARLGINSKMRLAKVLPIVSKSIFGKISAAGRWATADEKLDPRLRIASDPVAHTFKKKIATHEVEPGDKATIALEALADGKAKLKAIFGNDPIGNNAIHKLEKIFGDIINQGLDIDEEKDASALMQSVLDNSLIDATIQAKRIKDPKKREAAIKALNRKFVGRQGIRIGGKKKKSKKKKAGRSVKATAKNIAAYQKGLHRTSRLRPGEDPEIAKQALKDAAKLVTGIWKENPKKVVESFKDIGTHFTDILKKEYKPGYNPLLPGPVDGGCNGDVACKPCTKKLKGGDTMVKGDDGKVTWILG